MRSMPVLFLAVSAVSQAIPLYVTNSSNQLALIDSATPGSPSAPINITGLQAAENLLGIDFRPATGELFALGSTSRLYTINPSTGAATQVGTAGAFSLSGTAFGFDFNPTVDRIRVVSDTGQNLRLNPNDGTLAATDGTLNGAATGSAAAGYTNSFAGSTATTLYGIDPATDSLFIQNPPNAGTMVLVGPLGFNTDSVAAFDISPQNGVGYAALHAAGGTSSSLYSINLSTGAATLVGAIGGGQSITGLASPAPEPGTLSLAGLAVGVAYWLRRRRRGC